MGEGRRQRCSSKARASPAAKDPDRLLHTWCVELEDQRHRLADQLNDDPVQTLAHVTRLLQSVDDLPGASPEATQAVREAGVQVARVGAQLRRLARELRPPLLDDVGLGAALRQLAADFRAETGIPTSADVGEVAGAGRADADLTLFRLAQAVLRHSEQRSSAPRVDIRLRNDGSRVTLTVQGSGELPTALTQDPTPGGLWELRQRLQSIGGQLSVRTTASHGSIVSTSVVRAD